ncbi:MAG TPA: DUF5703 domain-containing protein, partial [Fimbriimonadaceae bacterium]|nr:DUF5703 domain-containing protein [Fimbriimonadaceae bacterium]
MASTLPNLPVSKLEDCDVIWRTPSVDAAGSMPIGNGEVVLNVWVEDKTGDLLFYIARTDALSEISRFLKLGRIRVHLSPPAFTGRDFAQHLHLHDGTITIAGGGSKMTVYVDSGANVIHVLGSSAKPVSVTASVECWRNAPRQLPKEERYSSWTTHDAPFPLIESADVFLGGTPGVTWYHRNETSVVPQVLANQSLTGLPGTFDPILHRTFGGTMQAAGFGPRGDRAIASIHPLKRFDLRIATASAQTATAGEWLNLVRKEDRRSTGQQPLKRTMNGWHAFWDRSWMFVEGDGGGEPIPQNDYKLLVGVDQHGQNRFQGEIDGPQY